MYLQRTTPMQMLCHPPPQRAQITETWGLSSKHLEDATERGPAEEDTTVSCKMCLVVLHVKKHNITFTLCAIRVTFTEIFLMRVDVGSSDGSLDICPHRDYAMRQDGYVIPPKEFIWVRYYTSKETFNYLLCLANLEIAGYEDLITQQQLVESSSQKIKLDIYRSTMWLSWCYANIDFFTAREKLSFCA